MLQESHSKPRKKLCSSVFIIYLQDGEKIDEINLRVGYTDGLYYGGQIGYNINEEYRGNGYAGKTCKLVAKLAKLHKMEKLLITNEYRNVSSMRVCEKIGARLLRKAEVPAWHEMYKDGKRYVNVYECDITCI